MPNNKTNEVDIQNKLNKSGENYKNESNKTDAVDDLNRAREEVENRAENKSENHVK